MKTLLNMKMAKGTLVRDHVLKMIAHLNELEILGAEIDGKSQVDIMLISLSSPLRFSSFCSSLQKKKKNLSLLPVHSWHGQGSPQLLGAPLEVLPRNNFLYS